MLDPAGLYRLEDGEPQESAAAPVLVHALGGFIDAGSAGRLGRRAPPRDPRAHRPSRASTWTRCSTTGRRPAMTFVEDHWQDYAAPELVVHRVVDAAGTVFSCSPGPEPDVQWERFVAATVQLVERFGVRLTVGIHAIPDGGAAHPAGRDDGARHPSGSSPASSRGSAPCRSRATRRAPRAALGQAGHDAAGFAVHVPHYLARTSTRTRPSRARLGRGPVAARPADRRPARVRRGDPGGGRGADRGVAGGAERRPRARRAVRRFVRGRHRSLLADEVALPAPTSSRRARAVPRRGERPSGPRRRLTPCRTGRCGVTRGRGRVMASTCWRTARRQRA